MTSGSNQIGSTRFRRVGRKWMLALATIVLTFSFFSLPERRPQQLQKGQTSIANRVTSVQTADIDNVPQPHASRIGATQTLSDAGTIRLCQACGPLDPSVRIGVDCQPCDPCGKGGWRAQRPIPWQALLQGEYVGPPRLPHVQKYLVRAGDQIDFLYRRKREMSSAAYQLNVGDRIRVESLTDEKISREIDIQLDGMITLPPAFQVRAAGRTVEELTQQIEERYKKWYKVPAITVSPVDTERRLQDLLAAVDSRFGTGGLSQQTTVTPEGTVQLPGIGSVPVNGLSLDEIQNEVEQRYAQIVLGIGVNPRLTAIAPRFVYVGGEVLNPGRFDLQATPTSLIMAIEMAGSWRFGANLREIVIFRRAEDWRLIATKVDLNDALLGRTPCPDDIWLRDADIIYVPKGRKQLSNNFIDLIFTQGLYRVLPINFSHSTSSTL